jgi:hypothetical protein
MAGSPSTAPAANIGCPTREQRPVTTGVENHFRLVQEDSPITPFYKAQLKHGR